MKILRNILSLLGVALLTLACSSTVGEDGELTQYVDQRIGTGGHGHVFLGANVPFGLVQLGPTEPTRGWDWCSGYHDSDSVLIGFSHMHLSGTGIGDLGDVTFLPVANAEQDSTYFSHKDETVRVGYYALQMHNPEVKVELTATKRVGMHRYTFQGKQALLKVDLQKGIGWDSLTSCGYKLENEKLLTGFRRSQGWAKDQQIWFAAEFSQPVKAVKNGTTQVVLQVADPTKPLLVKVGLSPVSVANAKLNLQKEVSGWDFDEVAKAADKAWNIELGKIKVDTDNDSLKTVFYTAMYHAFGAPSVYNDVNGEYRGADGKVYKGNFTNYTTLSLWDTYRAEMPLLTLVQSNRMADMAATFIHIYEQQGRLPVWHLMGNETDCMVGNPGVIILADLTLKGYVKDKEKAYEALKNTMMGKDRGLDLLAEYGYLPTDLVPTHETVAKTLEYAIADAGVAKVAKMLGKEKDYEYFLNRSQSYKKLFDKRVEFMRGLDSKGNFREPFNPFHAVHRQDDYTEGNAWQYLWLVPQDVHGLVSLFPSEQQFVNKLDSLFFVEGDLGEDASPDIAGLIGQYAHGNEPSHHIIYMYNYVGQPWKAAPLLRRTMSEMYKTGSEGLSGNEDVGQMSAWYIMSSVGLYQVDPSGGKFIIGTPLFDRVTLSVANGKKFTIVADNNSAKNIYVQSAKLNGKPLTHSYLNYADIIKGGKLELLMGSKPSTFGAARQDRP